jgi:hypothetical protein
VDIKVLWDSTIGKGVAAILAISGLLTAVWAVDDRYAKNGDVKTQIESSEGRIISEVRTESAETRLVLMEDMESRLDEYEYEISIIERTGDPVPEVLRIKRNMLERRIERLKNENPNSDNTD